MRSIPRYDKETQQLEARDGNGIYHKKRQSGKTAERLRRRRRLRQPQAVLVGGVDRPRVERICERNHPPRRHGGQTRRNAPSAQCARHARRSRASARFGQGTRLSRQGVPLRDQVGGQAPERDRILRGGGLHHRGEGQAARGRVAHRACGRRRDGGRLPLRPDEEREIGGAPAAAQADAVGAAALRPRRRRGGRRARARHCPRHGPRPRSRQPAGQHLHAEVSRRARARAGDGVSRTSR